MDKFRQIFKEDFELSKAFGQRVSSGQGSVGPASTNFNSLFQSVAEAIPEEENRKSHDTKMLPFPLDRIVDQLADNYETLVKTRLTLQQTLKSTITLDQTEKNLIKEDIGYINKCINVIKKISRDIEQMKI
jgi:hypothetical protein